MFLIRYFKVIILLLIVSLQFVGELYNIFEIKIKGTKNILKNTRKKI